MATNRTRIKRAVRSRATDEARAMSAYMDLNRELDSLLGLKPWETQQPAGV
jgi:hypothetical protein